MLPVETISIFFLCALVLALAPGPDNIFVLAQSAMYGRNAGLIVTLGLCTGLSLHTAAVSLGVAAVIGASVHAFNALKIAGGLYLLYLAWQTLKSNSSGTFRCQETAIDVRQLYVRGVIMNVTNPKVAIFFLAFLPQFASPANGSVTLQVFLLGGLFIVATVIIFSAIAWSAGYLGEWLRESEKVRIFINRSAAMIFIALAIRLLASGKNSPV